MADKHLQLAVKVEPAYLANVIKLSGSLESSNAEEIYQEIHQSIQQKVEIIVIDIIELKIITRGGNDILQNCQKIAPKYGIKLFISRDFL